MALSWPIKGTDVLAAMSGTNAFSAEGLEDYATGAVARVEKEVGPWHGQELTHRVTVRRTRSALLLPWPVDPAGVLTVTVDGTAVSSLSVDPDAGLVYGRFPVGQAVVTAAARPAATVPDDVILAARYLGAFWARQEKITNPRVNNPGTDPDTTVMQGFAMPRRVSEMLLPYLVTGGVA